MKSFFLCLLFLGCDSSSSPVDACSDLSLIGERCVTFHLVGEASIADSQLTSVLLWVGYQTSGPHNVKLQTVMREPTSFPVAVGLHLPQGLSSAAQVHIEALAGPGPQSYQFTTTQPNPAQHVEFTVTMQPTALSPCFDQHFNSGIESDVDCGRNCPPCAQGARCTSALDCVSTSCSAQGLCN